MAEQRAEQPVMLRRVTIVRAVKLRESMFSAFPLRLVPQVGGA